MVFYHRNREVTHTFGLSNRKHISQRYKSVSGNRKTLLGAYRIPKLHSNRVWHTGNLLGIGLQKPLHARNAKERV